MLLGVVSDTHGHVENTRRAVRVLEQLAPDVVIHCGDIGSAAIVPLFAAWPTHFVLGNVDDDAEGYRLLVEGSGQTFHGRFGALEAAGRRIAFLHGDDQRRLTETIAGEEYDLVCHGHTHRAEQRVVGKTLVLNPGALYRANPHSLATVDVATMEAMHIPL
ncbi:MAG: YfcE family phosphodiesterase [Planctomycetes bacterium]|nr:YfcE family phosphodiesterase [Planctomycetota bacterium]